MIHRQTIPTKMKKASIHTLLNYAIAAVWLANGLFCKALHLVPRHEQIVAGILGDEHSRTITLFIGISETLMAVWIVSRIFPRVQAITQMAVVATMNALEFVLVPDLLLWGKLNALFAGIFIFVVYYNEFHLRKKTRP